MTCQFWQAGPVTVPLRQVGDARALNSQILALDDFDVVVSVDELSSRRSGLVSGAPLGIAFL